MRDDPNGRRSLGWYGNGSAGTHDDVKGQIPRALVVLGDSAEAADPNTVIDELVALVRKEIGPVAAFKRVDIVSGLPKTRSVKSRSYYGRANPPPLTVKR